MGYAQARKKSEKLGMTPVTAQSIVAQINDEYATGVPISRQIGEAILKLPENERAEAIKGVGKACKAIHQAAGGMKEAGEVLWTFEKPETASLLVGNPGEFVELGRELKATAGTAFSALGDSIELRRMFEKDPEAVVDAFIRIGKSDNPVSKFRLLISNKKVCAAFVKETKRVTDILTSSKSSKNSVAAVLKSRKRQGS